jgi:hypothetical protein
VGSTQSSVFALGPITYADVDAPPCKAAYAVLADFGKRLDPELHLLPAQYGPLPPGLKTVVEGGLTRMITLLMQDPAGMSGGMAWAWAAFAKLGLCTWLKGETRVAAVRAVMTSWPFNFPAAVLQSALECIDKRRVRATCAARDAPSPEEDTDDTGKGPEEFENFDPSRDDEDEATPTRRQRHEGHRQQGLRRPSEGLPHGTSADATGAERDGPDTSHGGT